MCVTDTWLLTWHPHSVKRTGLKRLVQQIRYFDTVIITRVAKHKTIILCSAYLVDFVDFLSDISIKQSLLYPSVPVRTALNIQIYCFITRRPWTNAGPQLQRIELLSPKCKCSQTFVFVMLVFTIHLLPRAVWSWTGGVSTNTATVTLQHRGVL